MGFAKYQQKRSFKAVSTPLLREEVKLGLKMKDFVIFNMPDRFSELGDIFKLVLSKDINLEKPSGIIRKHFLSKNNCGNSKAL